MPSASSSDSRRRPADAVDLAAGPAEADSATNVQRPPEGKGDARLASVKKKTTMLLLHPEKAAPSKIARKKKKKKTIKELTWRLVAVALRLVAVSLSICLRQSSAAKFQILLIIAQEALVCQLARSNIGIFRLLSENCCVPVLAMHSEVLWVSLIL